MVPSRDSALSSNPLIVNSVMLKVRLYSEHMCGSETDGEWVRISVGVSCAEFVVLGEMPHDGWFWQY